MLLLLLLLSCKFQSKFGRVMPETAAVATVDEYQGEFRGIEEEDEEVDE